MKYVGDIKSVSIIEIGFNQNRNQVIETEVYRSGKWNHDWHQLSFLRTWWICWTCHDIGGSSDLSEGLCKHKVWSNKIYTEIVYFPKDILSP